VASPTYNYNLILESVPKPGKTAVFFAASGNSGDIKCFGTLSQRRMQFH